MKLKQLFTAFIITSCILLGFTACNDEDYAPIELQVLNEEVQIENNTLQLNAFSLGESFGIIGGNGRYVIENKNENIVDYRYDGHTLKFIPVGVGTATVIISDFAGNKMTLTIEVSNPTALFKVIRVESKAYGDDMTGNQMKTLEKQILEDAVMKTGGDILLTYTNKEYSMGSVTIHPTSAGRPIVGTFKQTHKTSASQVPYQELEIRMADSSIITWQILNYEEEPGHEMLLQEDVTAKYKGIYTALENARLTYTITR